ncbi:hypothetical protein D3C87_894200 [compost metagenome]
MPIITTARIAHNTQTRVDLYLNCLLVSAIDNSGCSCVFLVKSETNTMITDKAKKI